MVISMNKRIELIELIDERELKLRSAGSRKNRGRKVGSQHVSTANEGYSGILGLKRPVEEGYRMKGQNDMDKRCKKGQEQVVKIVKRIGRRTR